MREGQRHARREREESDAPVDHDVGEGLVDDHRQDRDSPEDARETENLSGRESTEAVGPSGLGDHVSDVEHPAS